MDMNGHINNVTYLAWTLESLPERVMSGGYKMQEVRRERGAGVGCRRCGSGG